MVARPAWKLFSLSENTFNVNQALMYYGAAAAHYSRAAYLRSCAADMERRSDRGGSRSGAAAITVPS